MLRIHPSRVARTTTKDGVFNVSPETPALVGRKPRVNGWLALQECEDDRQEINDIQGDDQENDQLLHPSLGHADQSKAKRRLAQVAGQRKHDILNTSVDLQLPGGVWTGDSIRVGEPKHDATCDETDGDNHSDLLTHM